MTIATVDSRCSSREGLEATPHAEVSRRTAAWQGLFAKGLGQGPDDAGLHRATDTGMSP